MDVSVQRIVGAIERNEQVAVYGDYDVDGVSGTALLMTFFQSLGLHVAAYIPERQQKATGSTARQCANSLTEARGC